MAEPNEVGYLLPRILELIPLNEEIHHSNEINLTWLKQVPRELWSKKETEYFDRFALVY